MRFAGGCAMQPGLSEQACLQPIGAHARLRPADITQRCKACPGCTTITVRMTVAELMLSNPSMCCYAPLQAARVCAIALHMPCTQLLQPGLLLLLAQLA